MMIEVRAIVSGRVQGIGFRATVKHYADKLGIRGTVQNLPDGTVEIYAQADELCIQDFFAAIEESVGNDTIKKIESDLVSAQHSYDKFRII